MGWKVVVSKVTLPRDCIFLVRGLVWINYEVQRGILMTMQLSGIIANAKAKA